MILTCPACDTRYFVGEDAVPEGGRSVRCAACAHEWRAMPEAPPLPLESTPAAPLPKAFRAKVAARKEVRQAMAAGVVWAVLTAGFVVVALAAVLFKVEVVRLWPRTASAYAALRMPVNPTGLALEGVQGGPGLENGRAVLVVSGAVRNIETAPRAPQPLRVSLFDKAGARAAAQLVQPAGAGPVAPGEVRAFRAVFFDPPLGAREFGVDFAFDVAAPRPPPRRIGKAAPTLALRTATPAAAPAPPVAEPTHQAQALPADSPYALKPDAPARP